MSKIEEMAAKYKKMHPSATIFGNKEVNREVEYAYIDGANAVFREIEPLVATLRSGARKLFEEKFKELKGK